MPDKPTHSFILILGRKDWSNVGVASATSKVAVTVDDELVCVESESSTEITISVLSEPSVASAVNETSDSASATSATSPLNVNDPSTFSMSVTSALEPVDRVPEAVGVKVTSR